MDFAFNLSDNLEVMGDAMEEVAAWDAYEAEMAEQAAEAPTEAEMEAMARFYGEA